MKSKIALAVAGTFAAAAALVSVPAANAATAGTATGACANLGQAASLPPGAAQKAARPTAAAMRAAAAYKAAHDTEAAALRRLSAAGAKQDTGKRALLRSEQLGHRSSASKPACASGHGQAGHTASAALTNSVINGLVQYGQVLNSFCGPAVVAEMSATVRGAGGAGLDQYGVANYMAGDWHNVDKFGTYVNQEVNGLNNYVGLPYFRDNYYVYVYMNYNPTSADRSGFITNLGLDVAVHSPVAGDAWEVPGGPHLVGHPAGEEIKHYFEIGGYSNGSVYYADSATTVWGSVPAYSWMDAYTVETILGGIGYIW